MGTAAASALIFGRLFDRFGHPGARRLGAAGGTVRPLAFLGGLWTAVGGVALWGIGMGAQESVAQAAIADMVPANRRAGAYGLFDTGYGVAWFLGSAAMGILYDRSLRGLIGFSVIAQLASLPLLVLVARRVTHQRRQNTPV